MIKHISGNNLITTNWSGGTTTQLYIYPEEASYAERNFLFRISTATVETEASVFTALPGIHRHLMVLEGILHIIHEDHYEKTLHAFDQDEFEGEWTTYGKGKVRDFNVMLRENGKARMQMVKVFGKEVIESHFDFTILYICQGGAMINRTECMQGDVLIAHKEEEIEIISPVNSTIILVDIQL